MASVNGIPGNSVALYDSWADTGNIEALKPKHRPEPQWNIPEEPTDTVDLNQGDAPKETKKPIAKRKLVTALQAVLEHQNSVAELYRKHQEAVAAVVAAKDEAAKVKQEKTTVLNGIQTELSAVDVRQLEKARDKAAEKLNQARKQQYGALDALKVTFTTGVLPADWAQETQQTIAEQITSLNTDIAKASKKGKNTAEQQAKLETLETLQSIFNTASIEEVAEPKSVKKDKKTKKGEKAEEPVTAKPYDSKSKAKAKRDELPEMREALQERKGKFEKWLDTLKGLVKKRDFKALLSSEPEDYAVTVDHLTPKKGAKSKAVEEAKEKVVKHRSAFEKQSHDYATTKDRIKATKVKPSTKAEREEREERNANAFMEARGKVKDRIAEIKAKLEEDPKKKVRKELEAELKHRKAQNTSLKNADKRQALQAQYDDLSKKERNGKTGKKLQKEIAKLAPDEKTVKAAAKTNPKSTKA